jgi:hypothetical protein
MFADDPKEKLVVNVVEQALDIKFYNPVVFPTALARDSYGIECRL